MKKVKPFLKMIMMFTLILCINSICGKASGPLDGQVIDGSLLTSGTVASDEQPLVLENLEDNAIVPYGTYLSNGAAEITNSGNGVVYVSGSTYCYRVSDKVDITLYLERLTNSGWSTYKTHHSVAYNTHVVSTGLYFAVPTGYYYRVKGAHVAKKGSTIESCTTCTSGIYIG